MDSSPLDRGHEESDGEAKAPIHSPKDLLNEALRRISQKKQEQIVERVAEEVARIQVKSHEARVDAEMMTDKVEEATQTARRLGETNTDFEYNTTIKSEHTSVYLSVKNKQQSIKEKTGCFVATACYGNVSHPAVTILRRFRDNCLESNRIGRRVISWYYQNSPRYAALIETRRMLRFAGRVLLWPLVVVALAAVWLTSKGAMHHKRG